MKYGRKRKYQTFVRLFKTHQYNLSLNRALKMSIFKLKPKAGVIWMGGKYKNLTCYVSIDWFYYWTFRFKTLVILLICERFSGFPRAFNVPFSNDADACFWTEIINCLVGVSMFLFYSFSLTSKISIWLLLMSGVLKRK